MYVQTRRLSCEELNKHSAACLANDAKECGKLKNSIFFIASFSLCSSIQPFLELALQKIFSVTSVAFTVVIFELAIERKKVNGTTLALQTMSSLH